MFMNWKNKRELKKKQLKADLREADIQLESQDYLLKTISDARNQIVTDPDESDWTLLGQTGVFSEADHENMLDTSFKLYHNNPYARTIIRTLVKFTFGKGPLVIPEDEDKKVKETWEEFKEENKWNKREKEVGTRTFRDGEMFLRQFVNEEDGSTKVRFIRANNIANPKDKELSNNVTFGIQTEPDDIETPVAYYKVDGEGNFKERIKADEVIHEKILSDSDQKRGITVLRVCAKRIQQYDSWLEDRIALNKVRSAIALVRTVDSSSGKIQAIRDSNQSTVFSGDRKKQKAMGRATIITASKGVEYSMLSPNINASDVAEDGRSMLLSIAAAVGFPEMIFTSDYANANYSSSLIAQNPFVREIEDWQDFFSSFYKKVFKMVITNKINAGKLPSNIDTNCRIEWPIMISANIEEMAKAYEILFKFRIISVKTWRSKMSLDDDIENANQEGEEDVNSLFGSPTGKPADNNPNTAKGDTTGKLNLPLAATNQFGQLNELNSAIENKDWSIVEEFCEEIGGLPEVSANLLMDLISSDKENFDYILSESTENQESLEEDLSDSKDDLKKALLRIKELEENNLEFEKEKIKLEGEYKIKAAEAGKPETNIKHGDVNVDVTESQKKIENNISIEPAKVETKQDIIINEKDINIENKIEAPIVKNKIDAPVIENKIEAPIVNLTPEMKIVLKQKKTSKKVVRDKNNKVIEIIESEI